MYKKGDNILLDVNNIYNMDCREGMKLLNQNSIDLVITSPPYNVGIPYNNWDDTLEWDSYLKFTEEWLREVYRVLKRDGRIALNIPYEINIKDRGGRKFVVAEYHQIMQKLGLKFAGIVDLVEDNPHRVKLSAWGSFLSPKAPYIYNPKECVLIYYKEEWKKEKDGQVDFEDNEESKQEFKYLVSAMWKYMAETKKYTQANFSLDIPIQALKILSYKDDIVLDPFMGSGTTAVACKLMGRNYIGFEISSDYIEVANKRLKMTY